MTTSDLLAEIARAGITLTRTAVGSIRFVGPTDAVARWLPELKAHKAELLEALSDQGNDSSRAAPAESAEGQCSGFPDDMAMCRQCEHLTARGVCRVAGSVDGPADTVRGFSPALDVLRRCETFRPRSLH